MRTVFLDFGTNQCQGLAQFINMYGMDESWEIHTFEPNPNLNELIGDKLHTEFSHLNVTYHPVAIGESNDKIELTFNPEFDEGASTRNWFGGKNSATVDQRDVVEVFNELNLSDTRDCFVVVKLDVEGSEFYTLDRLMDQKKLNVVDHLYVEWHVENMHGHQYPSHLSDEEMKHFDDVKSRVEAFENIRYCCWG